MGPKSAASTKGRGPSKSPAPKSRDKKADSKKGNTSRSKSPGPSKKTKVEDKKKSGANEKGKVAESKEAKDDTKETPETITKNMGEEPEVKKEESATKGEPAEEDSPSPDAKAKEDSPSKPKKKRKVPMSIPASGLSGKILMQAIVDNDADLLEFYLDHGPLADEVINFQNNSQMTPLMMATQKKKDLDCVTLIRLLLNAKKGEDGSGKVNIDMQNRDGYTALHFAARKGHAECVEVLVQYDADFTIVSTGSEKKTAEELATDNRCKQLLKNAQAVKEENERMKAVAVLGLQVYTAVLKGDLRGVVRVIEKKAKGVDVPAETFSYKPTPADHFPIRHAIDLGYYDIFKVLLEQDCEKDCVDSRGRTPLHHICSLKRAGSYPESRFSREKEAARVLMLTTFLEIGTTSEAMLNRRDKDGNTPLMIAVENGYLEDISILLEYGVDVDARQVSSYPWRGYPQQREKHGDTPFVLMARRRQGFNGNYMEVLETLFYDGKADINATGGSGMSALMWAAHHEDLELMDWLIGEGAEINMQSHEFGSTALMYATEHLRFRSIKFLVNYSMEELERRRELEEIERKAREEEEREAAKLAARKARKTGVTKDDQGEKKELTPEEQESARKQEEKEKKEAERAKNRQRSKSPQKKGKDEKKSFKTRRGEAMMSRLGIKLESFEYPRHLGYYRAQDPDGWAKVDIPGADPLDPPKDDRECNVNVPVYNNATPLIALCRKSEAVNPSQLEEIVELLVAKGAKVNQKSTDGMSAIMWAVMNNNTGLAKQLFTAGAAPDTTDQLNVSLLDNAMSGQMRSLVKSTLDSWTPPSNNQDEAK